MDADHNLLIIPFVRTRSRSAAASFVCQATLGPFVLLSWKHSQSSGILSPKIRGAREAQPLQRRPGSRNKRREPFKRVEFSFNRCHQPRPPLWFPSLLESFLPLWVTGDHVSPLDLCSNMDEEMREMRETRAHGSFLHPRLPPRPPIASVLSLFVRPHRRKYGSFPSDSFTR